MARTKRRERRTRVAAWVGPWLRERRVESKEVLVDVSAALNLRVSTLSRIERGETFFPSDELPKFLDAYKLTVHDFGVRAREQGRAVKKAA
jgi:transcriptional regulator with XRE-family HTH domain